MRDSRFSSLSLSFCHHAFRHRRRDIPKQKSCDAMSGHAWNKDRVSEYNPQDLQKKQHVIPHLSNQLLALQRRNKISNQQCTRSIIACERAQCFKQRRALKARRHYLTLRVFRDFTTFCTAHSNKKGNNRLLWAIGSIGAKISRENSLKTAQRDGKGGSWCVPTVVLAKWWAPKDAFNSRLLSLKFVWRRS